MPKIRPGNHCQLGHRAAASIWELLGRHAKRRKFGWRPLDLIPETELERSTRAFMGPMYQAMLRQRNAASSTASTSACSSQASTSAPLPSTSSRHSSSSSQPSTSTASDARPSTPRPKEKCSSSTALKPSTSHSKPTTPIPPSTSKRSSSKHSTSSASTKSSLKSSAAKHEKEREKPRNVRRIKSDSESDEEKEKAKPVSSVVRKEEKRSSSANRNFSFSKEPVIHCSAISLVIARQGPQAKATFKAPLAPRKNQIKGASIRVEVKHDKAPDCHSIPDFGMPKLQPFKIPLKNRSSEVPASSSRGHEQPSTSVTQNQASSSRSDDQLSTSETQGKPGTSKSSSDHPSTSKDHRSRDQNPPEAEEETDDEEEGWVEDPSSEEEEENRRVDRRIRRLMRKYTYRKTFAIAESSGSFNGFLRQNTTNLAQQHARRGNQGYTTITKSAQHSALAALRAERESSPQPSTSGLNSNNSTPGSDRDRPKKSREGIPRSSSNSTDTKKRKHSDSEGKADKDNSSKKPKKESDGRKPKDEGEDDRESRDEGRSEPHANGPIDYLFDTASGSSFSVDRPSRGPRTPPGPGPHQPDSPRPQSLRDILEIYDPISTDSSRSSSVMSMSTDVPSSSFSPEDLAENGNSIMLPPPPPPFLNCEPTPTISSPVPSDARPIFGSARKSRWDKKPNEVQQAQPKIRSEERKGLIRRLHRNGRDQVG
ncbi:hypothetical protein L596_028456 [Steinernema carpocapsae]|uniref:Uncharacterized protein n=1 Tax=Steinernema carpocapsae TaxID=34508 RepID=A0A4U5LYK4_STECR|nr:hypothetical protein L596_028456 [Steinernema carpocapsae]